MKKFFSTTILSLVAAVAAYAAEPMPYEASLTDIWGTPSTGEQLTLKISVLDADDNVLYVETHAATTDSYGHVSALVGAGQPLQGDFDSIDAASVSSIDVLFTRADGSEMQDNVRFAYTPVALHAAEASTIVSSVTDDGRYRLVVDDSGAVSVQLEKLERIEIPEGYTRMIFHDEFDGEGLPDDRYWGYEVGYVRNGENQYFTEARRENCDMYDGVLHINVREDREYLESIGITQEYLDETGIPDRWYTSASIITKDKVSFLYGRIDVRAKLPAVKGTWPAIWLMPNDSKYGGWPRSGEIDIMEQVGFDPDWVHFTAHTSKNNGVNNKHHNQMRVPTCHTDFHVYSLEWSPEKLTWYVDGVRGFSMKRNSPTWVDWPFDQPFYVMLGCAWGGGWGGQQGLDKDSLPQTYEVDYVRIFQ